MEYNFRILVISKVVYGMHQTCLRATGLQSRLLPGQVLGKRQPGLAGS